MSKIDDIRDDVTPGSFVTLRLTRGNDITGKVEAITADCVLILGGNGKRARIYEDLLGGWDIHDEDFVPGSDAPGGRDFALPSYQAAVTEPSAGPKLNGFLSPTPPSDPADTPPSSDVIFRRARIDATMIERRKLSQLARPPVDFTFQAEEFDKKSVVEIRKEWEKARNQYRDAVKLRETSRLVNSINQIVRPLLVRCEDSPSVNALMGSFSALIGNQHEAIKHLRIAAQLSNEPKHWFSLAAASQGDATECFALRNYLLRASGIEDSNAWARYIQTALAFSDRVGLVAVFERYLSTGKPAEQETALEGVAHVLGEVGAEAAANAVVADLLKGDFAVDGWRSALEGAMPAPSSLLVKEEDAQPPMARSQEAKASAAPPANGSYLTGQINSFGNQNFGFIDCRDGSKYFFRIADVQNEVLKGRLLDGTWKAQPTVEFTVSLNVGQPYHQAIKVGYSQDVPSSLASANKLLASKQYDLALEAVKKILRAKPDEAEALRIQRKAREDMLADGIGLPKGKGPYAEAKRAQLVRKNLDEAERLYRKAIDSGDQRESAVKDLASLLMQRSRFQEAARLLESAGRGRGEISPYDNMLSTVYQHSGQHEKAIKILERFLARATGKARVNFYRRIAFSQFGNADYENAERTLRLLLDETGSDELAERWLEKLEEARAEGNYDEASALIGNFGALAESGLELTPLARNAIKLCVYAGVDPSKRESGSFSAKDVEKVEGLAKALGTSRPRDRANYYLSAAAMLSQRDGDDDAAKVYDFLRRYFASMGDASWIEKNAADAVRAFYLESLGLVSENEQDEAWRTLVRYLGTYSSANLEDLEKLLPKAPQGQRIRYDVYVEYLRSIITILSQKQETAWRHGLLEACSYSAFVKGAMLDAALGSIST